ncbi:hypothetical protein B296_00027386 [Ensete ventricosum]|uniref:Uncharacterized protein n=1 Tax=Ensete ventricosum TaxID=4639 RepID=A0A426ZU45_ENSVE|nr:hypothetical protein B296_00027386 [Ensete ventricosum]
MVHQSAPLAAPLQTGSPMAPNWEGPYRVIDVIRDGTYMLATMEGRVGTSQTYENFTHYDISKATRLVLIRSKYKRCREQK